MGFGAQIPLTLWCLGPRTLVFESLDPKGCKALNWAIQSKLTRPNMLILSLEPCMVVVCNILVFRLYLW